MSAFCQRRNLSLPLSCCTCSVRKQNVQWCCPIFTCCMMGNIFAVAELAELLHLSCKGEKLALIYPRCRIFDVRYQDLIVIRNVFHVAILNKLVCCLTLLAIGLALPGVSDLQRPAPGQRDCLNHCLSHGSNTILFKSIVAKCPFNVPTCGGDVR